jgi:type II secretory pathway component GspD/PulD (secretin)
MDVRPTMATLLGGVISTILISLGSFTNVAFQVPIGVPQVSLQQSYTSVTVPNGGTVLLGGFKSMAEAKFTSYIPFLGKIPIVKNLFRRKAEVSENRSLVILISGRIVNPRVAEAEQFNEN